MLYRKFWRLLKDLCVWQDAKYLRRKKARTVRDDRSDIMPTCVQLVSDNTKTKKINMDVLYTLPCRKLGDGTPVMMETIVTTYQHLMLNCFRDKYTV